MQTEIDKQKVEELEIPNISCNLKMKGRDSHKRKGSEHEKARAGN